MTNEFSSHCVTPLYTITYNGRGRADQINSNSFAYDPNDYRIEKDSSLYHLEGEHLEATYDSAGNLQEKYLRGVVSPIGPSLKLSCNYTKNQVLPRNVLNLYQKPTTFDLTKNCGTRSHPLGYANP